MARRSAAVRRAARDGLTRPTWLARIERRRLWNAPPSGISGAPVPNHDNSTTSPSVPSNASAVARPAPESAGRYRLLTTYTVRGRSVLLPDFEVENTTSKTVLVVEDC